MQLTLRLVSQPLTLHSKYLCTLLFSLFSRPPLPPYCLDFGYVIYGQMKIRHVNLKNLGPFPVSFNTGYKHIQGTGFFIDLAQKVRDLPGVPEPDSLEFSVTFDPAAAKCPEGNVKVLLPFNVHASL